MSEVNISPHAGKLDSSGVYRLHLLLPLVVTLGALLLSAVALDPYIWATGEDGPVEWATVVAYLAAAVVAASLVARWMKAKMVLAAIAYAALTLGFVFIAGEEVSWGERLLGFDGPEQLVQRNLQGEANLHNLLGRTALHGLYIVVALWGIGLGRAIVRRVPWLRPVYLYAPARDLMWWFLPTLAYYVYVDYALPLARLLPGLGDLGEGPPRFQEPVEFLLGVGFLVFVLQVRRRSALLLNSATRDRRVASPR